MQSVALGGKSGLSVVSAESAKPNEKYYNSSFVCVGFVIGFLLGTATIGALNQLNMHGVFSKHILETYMWRLPFILSFMLAMPILFKLQNLIAITQEEGNNYDNLKLYNENLAGLNAFLITKISLLLFFETACFYLCFVFLPNYLKLFATNIEPQIWNNYIMGMLTILIFTPVFGKLADKHGPIKNLKLAKIFLASIASILFYYPNIILKYNLFINIMFGISSAVTYGSIYGYIATLYPINMRFKIAALQINIVGMLCSFVNIAAGIIVLYGMHYNFIMLFLFAVFSYILLSFCKEEN